MAILLGRANAFFEADAVAGKSAGSPAQRLIIELPSI
jgi:hypothetical protein